MRTISLFVFWGMFLISCQHTLGANGVVLSEEGIPLDSVKISLNEDTGNPVPVVIHLGDGWTDSAGRFRMEYFPAGAGKPHDFLSLSKNGYRDTSVLLFSLRKTVMRDSLIIRMKKNVK